MNKQYQWDSNYCVSITDRKSLLERRQENYWSYLQALNYYLLTLKKACWVFKSIQYWC